MNKKNGNIDLDELKKAIKTLSIAKLEENFDETASIEDIAVSVVESSVKYVNERTERYITRSKMEVPSYFEDIACLDCRKLDMEYLEELNTVEFVKNHQNLVIWGGPGTGKTWMSKMFGASACALGIRTKYVRFPSVYDELNRLINDPSGQSVTSRIEYYARIPLLIIDEFPNVENMNPMLVQQFFDIVCSGKTSVIVCTQCQPAACVDLFSVKSVGQSIVGRVLYKAKKLHLDGPDLRLYTGC